LLRFPRRLLFIEENCTISLHHETSCKTDRFV
jgi:hypothetical protein